MVSFDIVSLFIRVPLARAIDLILDKMYGPTHTCSFSELKRADLCSKCQHRYELKWLLDISTKDSLFIFNEKLYCQTKGIAMGSPLGPLLADIYINYLESKLKRRLEENGVLYWKRHQYKKNDKAFTNYQKCPSVDVHNILSEHAINVVQLLHRYLLAYRASQSIDQINFEKTNLNYLQQEITSLIYKPNYIGLICYAFDNVISKTSLKISSDYFTSLREILKLNQVQELLLVVALQDSIHVKCQALARGHVLKWLPEFFQTISNTYESSLFSTSIYRKPTFTGLLLKWNSYVPHSYKFSAISPMIYRAIKIYSSYSSMHIEFEYIQNLV
ncbi:unnamed protein product [Rotaria magnacalcarata]|uniref:Reverse transcriptase domain-containing protein n=1 Tax=Rotaria magnacalcarata TaxID=392030 RepID=A0A820Q5M5_9BILA|nr:unnamed protein product [Rotaria magnacalcarata]